MHKKLLTILFFTGLVLGTMLALLHSQKSAYAWSQGEFLNANFWSIYDAQSPGDQSILINQALYGDGNPTAYNDIWDDNCPIATVQTISPGVIPTLNSNTIYILQPGTYTSPTIVNISGECIAIVGRGVVSLNPVRLVIGINADNIVIDNISMSNPGSNAIHGSWNSNATIHGVSIIGSTSADAMFLQWINNYKINNVSISNGNYGFRIENAVNVHMEQVHVFSNMDDGIHGYAMSDFVIHDYIVHSNGSTKPSNGITLTESSSSGLLYSGVVYDHGVIGIILEDGSQDIIIDDVEVYDNAIGIVVAGTSSNNNFIQNASVHHNTDPDIGGIAIFLSDNNYIYDVQTYSNTHAGLILHNTTDNVIQQLVSYDNQYGIIADVVSPYNSFTAVQSFENLVGFLLQGSYSDVSHLQVYNNQTGLSIVGVDDYDVEGIIINNLLSYNNSQVGVSVVAVENQTTNAITINNFAIFNNATGFLAYGQQGGDIVNRLSINNGSIFNNNFGIYLGYGIEGVIAHQMSIYNNTIGVHDETGNTDTFGVIQLFDNDNNIYNPQQTFIEQTFDRNDVSWSGNTIMNNIYLMTCNRAIQATNDSENNLLSYPYCSARGPQFWIGSSDVKYTFFPHIHRQIDPVSRYHDGSQWVLTQTNTYEPKMFVGDYVRNGSIPFGGHITLDETSSITREDGGFIYRNTAGPVDLHFVTDQVPTDYIITGVSNSNFDGVLSQIGRNPFDILNPFYSPFYFAVNTSNPENLSIIRIAYQNDSNESNYYGMIRGVVENDIQLTKDSNISTAEPGNTITYTITIQNQTGDVGTGTLIDYLPVGINTGTIQTSPTATYSGAINAMIWNIPYMSGNTTYVFQLTATVLFTYTGNSLVNTATYISDYTSYGSGWSESDDAEVFIRLGGECGTVSNKTYYGWDAIDIDTPGLCNIGLFSGFITTSTGYQWQCLGQNGGDDSRVCRANIVRCGDGTVHSGSFQNGSFSEQCDLGVNNNNGTSGCDAMCQYQQGSCSISIESNGGTNSTTFFTGTRDARYSLHYIDYGNSQTGLVWNYNYTTPGNYTGTAYFTHNIGGDPISCEVGFTIQQSAFCGDGIVNQPTEQCDGQPGCNQNCQWVQIDCSDIDITITPDQGNAPLTVTGVLQGTQFVEFGYIDRGDGFGITYSNPSSYIYTTPGNYTPQVLVSNPSNPDINAICPATIAVQVSADGICGVAGQMIYYTGDTILPQHLCAQGTATGLVYDNAQWQRTCTGENGGSPDACSVGVGFCGDNNVDSYYILDPNASGEQWIQVGPTPVSDGYAGVPSLVFDTNNTPYVAYNDSDDNGRAKVSYFNGSVWIPAGLPLSAGGASEIVPVFSNTNVLHVLYKDDTDSYTLKVKTYDPNTNTWTQLGAGIAAQVAGRSSLVFNQNNVPYVVYSDGANGYRATVQYYDGTSWQSLGSVSDGIAGFISLAFAANNMPYVAYRDNANGFGATVKYHDGSTWQLVGGVQAVQSAAQDIQILFDGNTPYILYRDQSDGYKTKVVTFNGSIWQQLGGDISPGFSESASFQLYNGDLHVAYYDSPGSQIVVKYYNGSSRIQLGAAVDVTYAMDVLLYIDSAGVPYVSYRRFADNLAMTVKYFDAGDNQRYVLGGGSASFGSFSVFPVLQFDNNDQPYVLYRDNTNDGRITVNTLQASQLLLVSEECDGQPGCSTQCTRLEPSCNDFNFSVSPNTGVVTFAVTGSFAPVPGFDVTQIIRGDGNNTSVVMPTTQYTHSYVDTGFYQAILLVQNQSNPSITGQCVVSVGASACGDDGTIDISTLQITVDKRLQSDAEIFPNGLVPYIIEVTNTSSQAMLDDVVILDVISDDMSIASYFFNYNGNIYSGVVNSGYFIIDNAVAQISLMPGQSIEIIVYALVEAGVNGSNYAFAGGTWVPLNNETFCTGSGAADPTCGRNPTSTAVSNITGRSSYQSMINSNSFDPNNFTVCAETEQGTPTLLGSPGTPLDPDVEIEKTLVDQYGNPIATAVAREDTTFLLDITFTNMYPHTIDWNNFSLIDYFSGGIGISGWHITDIQTISGVSIPRTTGANEYSIDISGLYDPVVYTPVCQDFTRTAVDQNPACWQGLSFGSSQQDYLGCLPSVATDSGYQYIQKYSVDGVGLDGIQFYPGVNDQWFGGSAVWSFFGTNPHTVTLCQTAPSGIVIDQIDNLQLLVTVNITDPTLSEQDPLCNEISISYMGTGNVDDACFDLTIPQYCTLMIEPDFIIADYSTMPYILSGYANGSILSDITLTSTTTSVNPIVNYQWNIYSSGDFLGMYSSPYIFDNTLIVNGQGTPSIDLNFSQYIFDGNRPFMRVSLTVTDSMGYQSTYETPLFRDHDQGGLYWIAGNVISGSAVTGYDFNMTGEMLSSSTDTNLVPANRLYFPDIGPIINVVGIDRYNVGSNDEFFPYTGPYNYANTYTPGVHTINLSTHIGDLSQNYMIGQRTYPVTCAMIGEVCGDGVVEGLEQCDNGSDNGLVCDPQGQSCSYCSSTCQLITVDAPYCGDGTVNQPTEICDDGNNDDYDGCTTQCQPTDPQCQMILVHKIDPVINYVWAYPIRTGDTGILMTFNTPTVADGYSYQWSVLGIDLTAVHGMQFSGSSTGTQVQIHISADEIPSYSFPDFSFQVGLEISNGLMTGYVDGIVSCTKNGACGFVTYSYNFVTGNVQGFTVNGNYNYTTYMQSINQTTPSTPQSLTGITIQNGGSTYYVAIYNTGNYIMYTSPSNGESYMLDSGANYDTIPFQLSGGGMSFDNTVAVSYYNTCLGGSYCGDGVIDYGDGEQCDLGPANGQPNSGCNQYCQIAPVSCNIIGFPLGGNAPLTVSLAMSPWVPGSYFDYGNSATGTTAVYTYTAGGSFNIVGYTPHPVDPSIMISCPLSSQILVNGPCANGATNPPLCTTCGPGQYYCAASQQCITTGGTCAGCPNGATNFPACNQCGTGQFYCAATQSCRNNGQSCGGGGGGGGGSSMDYCPNGDFSGSYYDGKCGEPVMHGAAPIGRACRYEDEQYLIRGTFTDSIRHRGRPYTEIMRLACLWRGRQTKIGRWNVEPDGWMQRDEALKTFVKILGVAFENFDIQSEELLYTSAIPFADVAYDNWFSHYTNYAFTAGLTQGLTRTKDGKTYLDPTKNINRYEFAKLVVLAYEKIHGVIVVSGTSTLQDVPITHPYADYVRKLEMIGLVEGYKQADGSRVFRGDQLISRAEVAKLVSMGFNEQLIVTEQAVVASSAYQMIARAIQQTKTDRLTFIRNLFEQLKKIDDKVFLDRFQVSKDIFLKTLADKVLMPMLQ